jgi:hypothetical protein
VTTREKQDQLEASLWRSLAAHKRHGNDRQAYGEITAAMNGYLVTFAEQYVARMTPEQWHARLRLAEATAEADRRAT